jgi:hypothetical protein
MVEGGGGGERYCVLAVVYCGGEVSCYCALLVENLLLGSDIHIDYYITVNGLLVVALCEFRLDYRHWTREFQLIPTIRCPHTFRPLTVTWCSGDRDRSK